MKTNVVSTGSNARCLPMKQGRPVRSPLRGNINKGYINMDFCGKNLILSLKTVLEHFGIEHVSEIRNKQLYFDGVATVFVKYDEIMDTVEFKSTYGHDLSEIWG